MQKGDALAFGAAPGFLIDRDDAGGAATRQGGVKVIDSEAQMVDSCAPLFDELGNRGSGDTWFEQFNQGITGDVACNPGAVGIGENGVFEAKDVAQERAQGVIGLHGKADVSDGGLAHQAGWVVGKTRGDGARGAIAGTQR